MPELNLTNKELTAIKALVESKVINSLESEETLRDLLPRLERSATPEELTRARTIVQAAEEALEGYRRVMGTNDFESDLPDLISDLLHLAEVRSLGIVGKELGLPGGEGVESTAYENYWAEKQGSDEFKFPYAEIAAEMDSDETEPV
jgi:hypothetical protein